MTHLRLVVNANTAALHDAQLAIADFLRAQGAGPRTAARAELLLEELALNALRHGGALELAVTAWHDGTRCGLDFEDRGTAFDPTSAIEPDRPASLRDARIGGLGVPLLHRMAAAADYSRTEDGRNLLRVVLPDEAAAIG